MSSLAGSTNSNQPTMPAIVSELSQRFNVLRLRYARWLVMVALTTCISIALGLWVLLATFDYWLELSVGFRQVSAAGVACMAAAAMVWMLWIVAVRSTHREFAISMERRFEAIGQRLRTVLDLEQGRLGAPPAMLAALGHQTMARWETAGPQQILPRRALAISVSALSIASVVLLLCMNAGPEMRTALIRAAGWDRPYTTMQVTPGDIQILEGLQPEVQLQLTGRPHRHVALYYRAHDANDWIEAELKGMAVADLPNALRFEAKLDKLTSDVQYQFQTDVGPTPMYTIKMQPKIVLIESQAKVLPPPYTQLPERTFGIEEVTVLAGSKVTITLQTNRPLKSVRLKIGTSAERLADSEIQPERHGAVCTFVLPSDQSLQWQFSGSGEDGAPLPTVSGKLRIRHDEQPRIDWQSPADEMVVNMLAEVPMSVLISDDYGLTHAGIVFELGDNEEFVLKEWTLAEADSKSEHSANGATTRLRLDEVLPLESFALSERDFVSYFAFADDNRPNSHQHAESEVRYLDIRPLKQFFSEVEMPPGGGGGGRSFPMLNELISRERYLYNRTRGLSRHYDASNKDQLHSLERMVATQSELANFTRFLIDFLVSQGNDNNEALGQAESVMLQASDALATADFKTAIVRELEAIRLLVEAKNTAEVSLTKNNNAALRAQLSSFQRQMVNRLRRKTKPADTKVADDLKQIAIDQGMQAARVATWLAQAATSSQSTSDASTRSEPASTEDPKSSSTPSTEEQLKANQQELLDRLTTVNGELSESVKKSSLATERLAAALLKMDGLTGSSNKGQWDAYVPTAKTLARELAELAEQVKAVAESDPARRISSLRDLTASLASQEAEFVNYVEQQQSSDPKAAETQKLDEEIKSRAERIVGRTQTIEDILKFPLESGDLRTSEIVDELEKLITQHVFREHLQTSGQAARNFAEQSKQESWSITTRDRAREHAVMAELFDQLHKQLVAPRVEQVRRLENQANQLAQTISSSLNSSQPGGQSDSPLAPPQLQAGGGEGKKTDEESGRDIRNLQNQLQSQLQSAGLSELAELLESQGGQGNESGGEKSGAAGSDSSGTGRSMGATTNQFSYDRLMRGHRNAVLVRQKLQAILQELVLLETTIDRNAPIPAEYKQLVDAYYKALAGE